MTVGLLPNTPRVRLAMIMLLGACAVAWATWTATRQPVLGIAFQPGAAIASAHGHAVVEELDLTPEPGELTGTEDLTRFYQRQDELAAIFAKGPVSVRMPSGGEQTISPASRSPTALPPLYWVQVVVGLGALAISGWVWALRPHDTASSLFVLSGLATLTFTLSAAIYSTRELAIAAPLFKGLAIANIAGASAFGIAMIALFLVYPVRLARSRELACAAAIGFAAWTMPPALQAVPLSSEVNVITLVEMVCICLCIGVQYVATRSRPEARAALNWFGLSVLLGAGGFIALTATPLVFGTEAALDQGYAFLFFLLIYLGLAVGLRRFRLFELGDWAFRILFYLIGAFVLIALDAVLTLAVSMERVQALGFSLVAVAFLYLPLRDILARRFLGNRSWSREALFGQVLDVALTPPGEDQGSRWRMLLGKVFDPLHVETVPAVAASAIGEEGLSLTIPAADSLPSLRLDYGYGGRRLFSPRDATLADELAAMLRHAIESRRAYEKGVAEERSRIARDMHDNIGAQLLGALHNRDAERKNTLIRETLSDLRDIINNASHPGLSLEETLADLRAETGERLSAAGLALEWISAVEDDPVLLPHAAHALRSVVREAASNVIKHADARTMRVHIDCKDGMVAIDIADDGRGFDSSSARVGYGLCNMQARMASLGGTFEVRPEAGGTRLVARFRAAGQMAAAS